MFSPSHRLRTRLLCSVTLAALLGACSAAKDGDGSPAGVDSGPGGSNQGGQGPGSGSGGDPNLSSGASGGGGEAPVVEGWGVSLGGPGLDQAWGVAADAADNVFVVGTFESGATFGGPSHTADSQDAFVASLDSSGTYRWSVSFGGPHLDTAYDVAVDPAGNVYAIGQSNGQVDFGAGPVSCSNDSTGAIFAVSFDSSGSLRWGKCFGYGRGRGIATDAAGNVYLTGWFFGEADFGGAPLQSSPSPNEGFVASLDSDGNHRWSVSFGSPTGGDAGARIAVDQNAVYVTGSYQGDMTLAGQALSSSGFSFDLLVAAFDPANGNPLWARGGGGPGDEEGLGVALLPGGELVVDGVYEGPMNLGGSTMTAVDAHDLFVAQLGSTGAHQWSSAYGAADFDQAMDVSANVDGIFLTGRYNQTLSFGPHALTSLGGYDAFVVNLDESGAPVWVKTLGGPGDDIALSSAPGATGAVYAVGRFENTWTADDLALTPHGSLDGFVVRLDAKTGAITPPK